MDKLVKIAVAIEIVVIMLIIILSNTYPGGSW